MWKTSEDLKKKTKKKLYNDIKYWTVITDNVLIIKMNIIYKQQDEEQQKNK